MFNISWNKMNKFDDLILLQIFSYLPLISLNKLKQVNKRWLKLIDETLEKRREFQIYTYSHETSLEIDNFIIDFKLNLINNLNSFISNQPDLFVYFLSQNFYSKQSIRDEKHKYLANISNQISSNLPSMNSIKLIISSQGFIHDRYYLSNESSLSSTPAIGGLLLSNQSNSFRFIAKQLINEHEILRDIRKASELYSFFGIDSNNESIRFMLILKNRLTHLNSSLEAHLSIFLDNLNKMKCENSLKDLIVNGCTINDAFLSNTNDSFCYNKQKEITFLLFLTKATNNDCVNLSQIVIPGQQTDDYIIESYFTKTKNNKTKKSLANYIKMYPRDEQFVDHDIIRQCKLNQLKLNHFGMANKYKFNLIFHTITESKLNKLNEIDEFIKLNLDNNVNSSRIIGLVGYNDGFIGHDSLQNDFIRFYFEECSSFTIISFK